MIPLSGQPIVTAAEMRAAEEAAMAGGIPVHELMERAGTAVAGAVRRLGGGAPVLVLCGPGNNGGDGYVAARLLADWGIDVSVAALGEPKTEAAARARSGWSEPVTTLADAEPLPVLVDAVFGTGLSRPLDDDLAARIAALAAAASFSIAVDVPSGVDSDSGAPQGCRARYDLVLALGAAKPAHVLQPTAGMTRAVRVADIGVATPDAVRVLARPSLPEPGPAAHKYSRGLVAVVGGAMPGAAELAALAAARSGAGYVRLLGDGGAGSPHTIVRQAWHTAALDDARIGAIVIGPGLGREARSATRVRWAMASGRPLVIDGDALHLVTPERLARHRGAMVLTPHAGEFDALFGTSEASKIERTRAAARASAAVVVFKGADTVTAAPDGRVCVSGDASDWLSTAGTGDVLAGAVGACLAGMGDPFVAACAAVWLHGEAARMLGKSFIADDLAEAMTVARGSL